MDSNRDDAERCLHLAQDALAANNFTKARRLLEKSQRMYPLPELQAALSAKISAASSSASASSPSSAQPSDDPPQPAPQEEPEPAKEPTRDMTAAVDAVWKIRNKSHYEVLGVAKDADENAIKKAYRRLALKLHPDRNCAPDADEAFKRVSQAFVTLSDSERRKHYDTFGTDDVAQLPRRSASCRSRRTANANFEPFFAMHHDLNADELFEFLFKTAAANNQPNRRRAEPVPEDTESFWERLKPMLLMFFVLLLAIILSKEADSSPFSLHRTAYHTVERATQSDISYFIPENLDLSSARMRRRLDEAVDRTALDDYSGKCAREREHAAYLLAQSRRWLMRESVRKQFRRKYDAFQQPWCARASRLYDRLDRRNHRRM